MNTHARRIALITTVLALLVVAGCGGGGGGGSSTLSGNVALAQAEWIVVNLATGEASGRRGSPDPADDSLRTDSILFVALPAGSGVAGSPLGTRWAQPDEVVGSAGAARIFVSVYEVTRGQWQRLASTTPWAGLDPALLGSVDERLPASGFSLDLANAGLATGSDRCAGSFRLLSAGEWEYACRAGSNGRFAWGDAIDSATVGLHAQVAETTGANPGPQRVGSRLANAYGLFDTHGSMWELSADGSLHGGSWRDSLPMARAANTIAIDRSTPHALAGLRLVYRPDGP